MRLQLYDRYTSAAEFGRRLRSASPLPGRKFGELLVTRGYRFLVTRGYRFLVGSSRLLGHPLGEKQLGSLGEPVVLIQRMKEEFG